MEQTQIETYLSAAVKLLHSSASDSAEKMRMILEAEILKNHDKNQTLSGKLTKKQMTDLLQQESKAVGSGFKVKRQKTKKVEDLKIETPPVINENQQIIKIRDDEESSDEDEDASTSAAMLLDDLTCKICRQMDNTANNPLLECNDCNQLYHSVCNNNTKIPSDTSTFVCSVCKSKKDKEGSQKSTKSYDSSASSSSSISHKNKEKEKEKEKEKVVEKEIKEKEKEKEKDKKSSSDKKKSESSSSSSRSSSKKESTSSSSSSRSRSSKK